MPIWRPITGIRISARPGGGRLSDFQLHPEQDVQKPGGDRLYEYVNAKRLDYAKELLLTTSYSIREISILSGFGNDNYFSRIFKASTGVSRPGSGRDKIDSLLLKRQAAASGCRAMRPEAFSFLQDV